MKDLFSWIAESPHLGNRPWLLLGKGPSFAKRTGFDLTAFNCLGLNHVVREQPVQIAHMIDIDVVDGCGETLFTHAQVVAMPWFPHVNQAVGTKTLDQWADEHPLLRRLREAGRLVWYNLIGTGAKARPGSPEVRVRYFSAEAALNILITAGVRTARSLGIDGGTNYSPNFKDLTDKTLLANGRSSFNRQFEEMARSILRSGIDFAPLDVESPIRVYVACSESEMLPVRVLEYSIKKHTSMSVVVTPLCQVGIPVPTPRDARNQARTPFSFQRFLIPEAAGRRGHGIYLDADMQVFKDFRALWMTPMDAADLLTVREPTGSGRRPQFSVMLLDCASLPWSITDIIGRLDSGDLTYEQLMYEMAAGGRIDARLDPQWNCLERFDEGETGLLHYTDMETQPWVYAGHRLGHLWTRDLIEAVRDGHISLDLVRDHAKRGFVRPSLLHQVETGMPEALLLPSKVLALDRPFRAPYTRLPSLSRNPVKRVKALLRHWYHGSLLQRIHKRVTTRR